MNSAQLRCCLLHEVRLHTYLPALCWRCLCESCGRVCYCLLNGVAHGSSSNRIECALNLQHALNSMEVFSQLVNNHIDTLPSDLDLLLQETNYNPVKSSINTVIEILNDDRVKENNVFSYVVNSVKDMDIQFANLNRLSKMLGFQTILSDSGTKTTIFHDTRHLINWIK